MAPQVIIDYEYYQRLLELEEKMKNNSKIVTEIQYEDNPFQFEKFKVIKLNKKLLLELLNVDTDQMKVRFQIVD